MELTYYSDNQRHLVCVPYSIANLHQMAKNLNINKGWFHSHPTHPHYDIPKRRINEIHSKSIVVSPKEILKITKKQMV